MRELIRPYLVAGCIGLAAAFSAVEGTNADVGCGGTQPLAKQSQWATFDRTGAAATMLALDDGSTPGRITQQNWVNHPAIVEIRNVYKTIKGLQQAELLDRNERRFVYCEHGEDTVRILYRDRNGVPRLYVFEGGGDDLAGGTESYYDDRGVLRFVYGWTNHVTGASIEYRLYFSDVGKKVWENSKRLGPDYAFVSDWPDDLLVYDPVKAFNAPAACPQEK